MDKEIKAASKGKRIYKLENGKRVQGVTTILSVLAKPALIKWANNLGLEGIDSSHYTDTAARIGTLAHHIIQVELENQKSGNILADKLIEPDTSMYGKTEIEKAYKSVASFTAWQKQHDISVIETELQLVSEKYKYGGTIDLLAIVDGKITLVDFKTGSGIYPEHYYQICAYRQLLKEWRDLDITQARILNIPRGGIDKFTEMVYNEFTIGWEIFKCCKKIYELQKKGGF